MGGKLGAEREAELFEGIVRSLEEMEKTKVVNPSIIPHLNKLSRSFTSLQEYWRDHQGHNKADAFSLYHASRNAELVLKKMEERFQEAPKKHDNPLVVEDAIAVIPALIRVHVALVKEKSTPSPGVGPLILRQTRVLRN